MELSEAEVLAHGNLYTTGYNTTNTDDLIQAYNKWAQTYEQDYTGKMGYGSHIRVAEEMCGMFPAEVRSNIRILDAGAGTGLLAQQLRECGFCHMDALDPSSEMLREARKRNLYENYFREYITEEPLDIEKGTYDVVLGLGMLGHNHAPFGAINEMIRLAKPGGYVILTVRKSLLEQDPEYRDLEPLMKELVASGKWAVACQTEFPNYWKETTGMLYVFKAV